jgi:glyoxylase-like metal-dependent hydrolase (beta-lactamase superfamily II)
MLPDEGLDCFEAERRPERILLTNRHHYRHSDRFVERYDCPVLCHEEGLHEFAGGPAVRGFAPGDEIAPGIVVHEVGAICPDEAALHIELGDGYLALADGIVNYDVPRFVPDNLIGDDPEAVKEGLREAFRRLCDLEFDSLLFAHGEPIVGGGKNALREFVA